jgi:hypothetical protein
LSTDCRKQIWFLQQICDHLLASLELMQIAQWLQNPRAQSPATHRRDGAIKNREQSGVTCAA